MRRWRNRVCSGTLLAVLLAPACSFAAGPVAVAVENASTPTLCAETDNVYLKLTSAAVRRVTIEAIHPAYAGTIVADRTAPGHDLRDRRPAADRPHVHLLLAAQHGPGPGRGARRDRPAPLAAVHEIQGAHRGGAGALSRRRLLARAPAAAGAFVLQRIWIVVFDRAGRDSGTALRGHPRHRVRSGDAEIGRASCRE